MFVVGLQAPLRQPLMAWTFGQPSSLAAVCSDFCRAFFCHLLGPCRWHASLYICMHPCVWAFARGRTTTARRRVGTKLLSIMELLAQYPWAFGGVMHVNLHGKGDVCRAHCVDLLQKTEGAWHFEAKIPGCIFVYQP